MPHIIELLGKTRVIVTDGKVIEVGRRGLYEYLPHSAVSGI